MTRLFVYFLLVLPLLACFEQPSTCDDGDQQCLQQLMDNHEIIKLSYWQSYFDRPLEERVFVAPPEVINYVEMDNRTSGYPNRPFAPPANEDFIADISAALAEIPDTVKDRLDDKLAGIFLVSDLGGTGYTNYIRDDNDNDVAAFVVLDYQVLEQRSANEWATWKESTPFKSDPDYAIEVTIQPEQNDSRKNAIQYILLHELGHVVSVNEKFHPAWNIAPRDIENVEQYEFFNESWLVAKQFNAVDSKYDGTVLADRKNVIYYLWPKLSAARLVPIYDALEQTNFPTLYAVTDPAEDWAESFVTYVHSVLMQKPFVIRIKNKGQVVKTFESCWGEPRCAGKQAIMAELFGASP